MEFSPTIRLSNERAFHSRAPHERNWQGQFRVVISHLLHQMYYNGLSQGKNMNPAFRMSEEHLFLQPGTCRGDSRLALSTDVKPRLKWTADLHRLFVEAVNHLGGPERATPKSVMRVMSIPGLTLYHLKSHLQKYRLSRKVHGRANSGLDRNVIVGRERVPEASGSYVGTQQSKSIRVGEALQIQIEVQRRLHEQLEVQRHLQLRIEAQGKYLKSVLEKAQQTLGRHDLGSVGLEAAKFQLSELAAKVSKQNLTSAFSDYPINRWLTPGEGCRNSQDLREDKNIVFCGAESSFARLNEEIKSGMQLLATPVAPEGRNFSVKRSTSGLLDQDDGKGDWTEPKDEELLLRHGPHFRNEKLDLNLCDAEDPSESKELDLNGFSWG